MSEHSRILDCQYCGARMMLDARQEPEAAAVFVSQFTSASDPAPRKSGTVSIVVTAVILALVGVFVLISRRAESNPTPSTLYAPQSPGASPASWSWTAQEPAKPGPIVNYQPKISWSGDNDLEHFEQPKVDLSSVNHMSADEVKKTVFKDRIVKLRVRINTDGEIDDVQTISGHPILVDAATASVKRSVFHSRSKPTSRVVTYTFTVIKD